MESLASASQAESASKPTEIEELHDKWLQNNVEIKEQKKYLQLENAQYKKRYNDLKQRLAILTESLENNAQVYQQLFDDTNSARQICTSGVAIIQSKKNLNCKVDDHAGPSKVLRSVVCHKKIHIEPLKIQELEDKPVDLVLDEDEEQEAETLLTEREEEHNTEINSVVGLSEEEGSLATTMKQLFVRLQRLPSDIVRQHTDYNSVLSHNSTLNRTHDTKEEGSSSSTARFLTFMNTLGLSPIKPESELSSRDIGRRFVTDRPKYIKNSKLSQSDRHSTSTSNSVSSPKPSIILRTRSRDTSTSTLGKSPRTTINLSTKASPSSSSTMTSGVEEKENFVTKRRRVSPGSPKQVLGRPTRKAKPKTLKEESLIKKKRRP